MASDSKSIIFYDIKMKPPIEKTACAPNPWKARLALNFKSLPYTTTWVALPDIAKVRSSLHVSAVRKFADGTDYMTLPILSDPSHDALVGDSFDIAVYLQQTYPDAGEGNLFPEQKLEFDAKDLAILIPLSEVRESPWPEYARFNVHVDAAFSAHVQLTVTGFPWDPESEEEAKKEFCRRAGVPSYDAFKLEGEAREKTLESFKSILGRLGGLFKKREEGPFLLGAKATYADIIVGGWLRMFSRTLPESEWEQVRGWHDALFGKLHDALEKYAEVK